MPTRKSRNNKQKFSRKKNKNKRKKVSRKRRNKMKGGLPWSGHKKKTKNTNKNNKLNPFIEGETYEFKMGVNEPRLVEEKAKMYIRLGDFDIKTNNIEHCIDKTFKILMKFPDDNYLIRYSKIYLAHKLAPKCKHDYDEIISEYKLREITDPSSIKKSKSNSNSNSDSD